MLRKEDLLQHIMGISFFSLSFIKSNCDPVNLLSDQHMKKLTQSLTVTSVLDCLAKY